MNIAIDGALPIHRRSTTLSQTLNLSILNLVAEVEEEDGEVGHEAEQEEASMRRVIMALR